MTGLGSSRSFFSPNVIGDRIRGEVHAGINDVRGRQWWSPAYKDACDIERELDKAEGIRLAYVASTRARDHLVLGLHHKADEARDVLALGFAETLAGMGDDVREIEPMDVMSRPAPTPATAATAQQVLADEEAWVARRRATLAAAVGSAFVTATSRAALAESEEARTEPDAARFKRGRGGTSVGRAVHAVLQVVDLASQEGLDTLARAQAAAEGIPKRSEEVARLAKRACESEPVRRAVASGRLWREVPVGAPSGGQVLEGFIDLLFQTPEGYEIVDYKTDALREDELEGRMDRYRIQGDAYAELVRAITGMTPVAVSFVFVSAGRVVRIEPAAPAAEPV